MLGGSGSLERCVDIQIWGTKEFGKEKNYEFFLLYGGGTLKKSMQDGCSRMWFDAYISRVVGDGSNISFWKDV